MRFLILISILFLLHTSITSAQNKANNTIEIYDFEELNKLLNTKNETTYIVNFWATWCAPCVEELPYFLELDKNFSSKNIEVILVSLDFLSKMESKLKPFIKNNKIQSKVILLDAPNENEWIPKVHKNWSGALPATIIFNKHKSSFFEQFFTKKELLKEVNKFVKIL